MNPAWRPAAENGWHGQLPVQTGLSSGHPASLRALDHPPIPAKKWHWVYPPISAGLTSCMSRSSTSPGAMCPPFTSSRSHAAANGSFSE